MEERFEDGTDYLLFIKPVAATNWLTVACLTTNGVDISREDIDISSKSSGKWDDSAAGKGSWTMNADGNAIGADLLPSEASYDILFDLAISGDKFEAKIAKVGSSYLRYGYARLSSYNEAQDNNAPFTFSATLKGLGPLSNIAP